MHKTIVTERDIPFQYDGRKIRIYIRTPSEKEIDDLEVYKITSPLLFEPNDEELITRRKSYKKVYKKFIGDLTLEQWRERLAMAPADVVRQTMKTTTQIAMSVKADNQVISERHLKSRFLFLR